MAKALLLDCDGVLADTELFGHLPAFNETFEEFGFDFRWSEEEYGRLLAVGGGKERFRKYITENPQIKLDGDLMDISFEVHKRKSELYVKKLEAGVMPPRTGIKRLVEEALDGGWMVASASTSAVPSVEAVLQMVVGPEIRARMSGVFAGDMVEKKKPEPDVYLLALKELGVSEDEAVVIEDSVAGATAAARANLSHLVTLSSYTVNDEFPDATTVVTRLGDPGKPSELVAGKDVRVGDLITLKSLEEILELRNK